ncbi:DUF6207 family protein [Streptomyces sp. NPDC050485]|uniref:DUF6207 family protein n=1 Tax=Streptomyces sp. NPDC050485 TaxID=3365617 RepID=UPI003799AB51
MPDLTHFDREGRAPRTALNSASDHRPKNIAPLFECCLANPHQAPRAAHRAEHKNLTGNTTADEATAHAVMSELQRWWATSGISTVHRIPGAPGVTARVHADHRRPGIQDCTHRISVRWV